MGEGWGEGEVSPSLSFPPARGGRNAPRVFVKGGIQRRSAGL